MNSRTVDQPAPPPPPPRYELDLSHTEMMHLAVVLYRHEYVDSASLFTQLPEKVRWEIIGMLTQEKDHREESGWMNLP